MTREGLARPPAHGEGVSGEQLRLLADANIIGVVIATNEGIVEANDAFLAIIGWPRHEFAAPIDWRSLTPPEYHDRDERAIAQMCDRGRCDPFEKEYTRKDGSRVPIQIGAALLDRDPMRWISFVQDISARKQLERELREAAAVSEMTSRAKDDFANMLVHELRQPIGSIAMAASIIRTTLDLEGRSAALDRPLALLDRQIALLTRLTDELLLASKIVRGVMPLRRSDVDLRDLVLDVAREERMRADGAGLTLTLDLPQAPVMVSGDVLRLRQVLANLLGNAIKYTPPSGAIRVGLTTADADCELRVIDTGVGIPADELGRVFEPFHRATRESTGFGLGLAVVHSIVLQHGGTIRVESDGPNRGTEVAVTLPIASPQP